MANWLKIARWFGKLLFTIKKEVSMMAYSFLKKTSHHSLTGWNSQGTHSNATCKSCCFLETLKKSFFPYFIDRRVWLNKRLEQTCIIWSQVKNTSFLPKKISRHFSAFFLWLQIWISFVLSRESSYEYLNNATLSAAANPWNCTGMRS